MKLLGRKALITGGTQGLGGAIVSAYVDAGAGVAFCGRTASDVERKVQEEQARLPHAQVYGFVCDVSNEEQIQVGFTQAIEALEGLDVLVNNAGIYGPIGPSEEVSFTEWVRAMEINLHGVFLASRKVIPMLKSRNYGKIINISGGGATNPLPRFSAYAASKAAVVRLMETLAEELREYHIDVNAVAPGALKTRMMEEVLQAGKAKAGSAFHAKNERWSADGGTPLSLGANLCVYLGSGQSDGITGKLISAQWDPWENLAEFLADLQSTDIYCLRRITPRDRGKGWGQEERK